MIVLTSAVVLPMVQKVGFDLIWFGIFIALLFEIEEVISPVGSNLFVLRNMAGKDSNTIARASLPFFAMLMVAFGIVTRFPLTVTWLPDVLMGPER
jgi:TRAP-type C4-dicarboxylate transport system permease large subunit